MNLSHFFTTISLTPLQTLSYSIGKLSYVCAGKRLHLTYKYFARHNLIVRMSRSVMRVFCYVMILLSRRADGVNMYYGVIEVFQMM